MVLIIPKQTKKGEEKMSSKLFKKYHSRLAKEGIIKSLLCGLLIGFSALVLVAGLFWLMAWKAVWVCAPVFVVITAASAWAFYHFKFHPTTKDIARRVDELGLEERMITMTQLEGDESYIAMRQREDALAALNTVSAGLIKLAVSVPLIISVAVAGIAGIGMTAVSALSAAEVIPDGQAILNPPAEEPEIKYFEVLYEVQEGEGMIEGEVFQIVEEGKNALGVMAVPDDEWTFVQWSDGLEDPYREDLEIKENMTIYAIFGELEEGEDGMPGNGEGEGEGDQPSDQPGEGEGEGDNEGEPSDKPGNGNGGKYEEINQIIDGETYYGDEYDGAYEDAMDDMEGGDYSDDEREIVGGYLDNIEK